MNRPIGFISPVADNITILPQNDICGLTKHEYIALELTKAWAATRAQGHETKEEIIETYVWLMNEVEKRDL